LGQLLPKESVLERGRFVAKKSSSASSTSNGPSQTESPKANRVGWKGIGTLLVIAAVALGISFGIVYFQEAALREAKVYLDEKDPTAALTVLDGFLEKNPQHTLAKTLKARSLAMDKKYMEASAIYQEIGPQDVEDLKISANCFIEQQMWTAALPLIIEYLNKCPDDGLMLLNLTRTQSLLELNADAKVTAERLLPLEEFERIGHVMLGVIEHKLGNNQGAIEHFSAALHDQPDTKELGLPAFEIYNEFGDLLLEAGQPEKALEQFKIGNEKTENVGSMAGIGKAIVALPTQNDAETAKNIAEAEQWLEKALNPQMPRDELKQREAAELLAMLANNRLDGKRAIMFIVPMLELKDQKSSTTFQMQRACQRLSEQLIEEMETKKIEMENAKDTGNKAVADQLAVTVEDLRLTAEEFAVRAENTHRTASKRGVDGVKPSRSIEGAS
jgi:tetratricopeptide (TPR) repeat protein